MLRPHIKRVISEMKLRVYVKDVLLILVSITDGRSRYYTLLYNL